MLISSRGKYGLRVIVDLAEHENGGYIPMKEVAKRQDISLKYLEQILPLFVEQVRIHLIGLPPHAAAIPVGLRPCTVCGPLLNFGHKNTSVSF